MVKALPDPSLPWPIPMAAVAIGADYEGCYLKAYRCPAGIPTIARGRTTDVKMGDVCTQEQADRWFCEELTGFAANVRAACTIDPGDNELGAMTILAYNIGMGGFKQSTVLKCHNRGDYQAASRAFGLWNKAKVNGVLTELPGLTARRAAEAALYLKPENIEAAHAMPQAVEAESSLAASPINRGGLVAAGTGVIGALTDAGSSVASLKGPLGEVKTFVAETLGLPPSIWPYLVLAAVGLAVVWWRAKQRERGWC
jgi:lysozyme